MKSATRFTLATIGIVVAGASATFAWATVTAPKSAPKQTVTQTSSSSTMVSDTTSESVASNSTSTSQSSQKASSEAKASARASSSQASASREPQSSDDAINRASLTATQTFAFNGINVPENISFNHLSGSDLEATITPKMGGSKMTYAAKATTIPKQTVRVFRANGQGYRDVVVDTQVTLTTSTQGAGSPGYDNATCYVFQNADGGLSLATPNFAGNVPSDQRDVMLEARQ